MQDKRKWVVDCRWWLNGLFHGPSLSMTFDVAWPTEYFQQNVFPLLQSAVFCFWLIHANDSIETRKTCQYGLLVCFTADMNMVFILLNLLKIFVPRNLTHLHMWYFCQLPDLCLLLCVVSRFRKVNPRESHLSPTDLCPMSVAQLMTSLVTPHTFLLLSSNSYTQCISASEFIALGDEPTNLAACSWEEKKHILQCSQASYSACFPEA